MAIKYKTINKKNEVETMVEIPLSALRCILKYPKEQKIICEISLSDIKQKNKSKTLDKIINGARFDYALGDYTTHTSAKSLLNELKS